MSHTETPVLQRSVQSAEQWIGETAEALGVEDRRYALRVLRAFLQTLRDRLSVEEAAQLASQLPELIRGFYYENWVPSRTPHHYHDAHGFLSEITQHARLGGPSEASSATAASFAVLRHHVSPGEIADVLAVMPPPVRELLERTAVDD
jgi:uncharacterized protein (DUF2267 family)